MIGTGTPICLSPLPGQEFPGQVIEVLGVPLKGALGFLFYPCVALYFNKDSGQWMTWGAIRVYESREASVKEQAFHYGAHGWVA